jgi:hypothetical protein
VGGLTLAIGAQAAGAGPAAPGAAAPGWPAELSGATRLPDRSLALVDDETADAVFLWDGELAQPPRRLSLGLPLDDLEGIAADSSGTLYLLASHSHTRRGRARPERERLARLRRGADLEVVDDITPALLRLLGAAPGQLNLEGLAWYPAGERLFLGARAPLCDGRAQVMALGPARRLFEDPRLPGDLGALELAVHALDLGGRGVRSLDYDPWRRAVLVLAGPPAADKEDGRAGAAGFALFVWSPEDGRTAELVAPELGRLAKPEGIAALGPPEPATGEQPILVAGEGAPPLRLLAKQRDTR